ncbi:dihydropteroate synthase [Niabella terrae]
MGVLNINADSFYKGSRFTDARASVEVAAAMLEQGATLLDIGGQSTRPGSQPVSANEEIDRVLPVVELLTANFPQAFISIDTYYGKVATAAVSAGACLVNDISAGSLDPELLPAVARLEVPYVLMHMQGRPDNMQQQARYQNVTAEVLDFLTARMAGLRALGIKDLIIDPGFGFGKTINHNFQLLRQLEQFRLLGAPVLLGISRKSTIYKTLETDADHALNGTTVLNTVGLLKGADILRVHDVQAAREAVRLLQAMKDAVKNDSHSIN